MLRYIGKRLLMLIPVMLGISFIIFSIMSLTPGDPARLILGEGAEPEAISALQEQMGLNDPFFVRFFHYVADALRGDFGKSWRTRVPVFTELFSCFPTTLQLNIYAIFIAVLVGIPIGILSAVRQYSVLDNISLMTSLLMTSLPGFWLGMMLILIFSMNLGWFPVMGGGSIRSFVLPAVACAMPTLAALVRMTRSTMLEVIRQDYIRTARAKGAAEYSVIFHHALRNALLPVITVVGTNFAFQMGGTVIIESVFALPGVGSLMITAVRMKDTPMVMACILFVAVMVGVINLLVDIVYTLVDPRIRAVYAKN